MRRHVIRTVLVGAATVAAVALSTGQAQAVSTITITGAGGAISGISTNAVFDDTTSGQSFACTGLSFQGTLANVTNAPLPYTANNAIMSWAASGCSSAFGTLTVTVPASALPDSFVFTAAGTTAPQGSGFLQTPAGVLFHFAVLTCSFNIGQINFTWTNGKTSQLRLNGTSLHPTGVSAGCFGLVSTTDLIMLNATFSVSPNTIKIT
ncbi:MAG TPA: hypothetical protein VFX16_24275 [Pseudonocardiaceae bacterium]|nr:hypothetical protein [Pseudonocardiaceae bacterium]